MCDTVPLSVLALDVDLPVSGWGPWLDAEGIEVVEDAIGRQAIGSSDAARLLGAQRAAQAFAEDQRRRHEAEQLAAAAPVPRGLPALPNMSAAQVMFAFDEGDRPKSVHEQLLDEEFARGRT